MSESFSQPLDTRPIQLSVAGPLKLEANIQPLESGDVIVTGYLRVALGEAVDRALGFLPWIVRTQLKAGMIQEKLEGSRFHFKIKNLFSLTTDVSSEGVLLLEKTYHLPLAQPIGHSETASIFKAFARGLARSGLHPFDESPIEQFLRALKRSNRGELAFLSLFEGKGIHLEDRKTPPVENLLLSELDISQDKSGSLMIEFKALGRLRGY